MRKKEKKRKKNKRREKCVKEACSQSNHRKSKYFFVG